MGLDVHPRCGRHLPNLVAGVVAGLLLVAVPARAQNLCPTGVGDCVVDHNILINTANATFDLGTRALIVRQGAEITVAPGPITITAASVLFESAAKILAPDTG